LTALNRAVEFAERMNIQCDKLVSELSILEEIDTGLHHESWLTLSRAMDAVESIGRNLGNLPTDALAKWLDLRALASSFNENTVDEVDQLIRDLHNSLDHHGCADPKLFAYMAEVDAMRSLASQAILTNIPIAGPQTRV
jgi:hypothetical protein